MFVMFYHSVHLPPRKIKFTPGGKLTSG